MCFCTWTLAVCGWSAGGVPLLHADDLHDIGPGVLLAEVCPPVVAGVRRARWMAHAGVAQEIFFEALYVRLNIKYM